MSHLVYVPIFASLLMIAGCSSSEDDSIESTPTDQSTLVGTVLMRPWTKSIESWNAAGSEYYVLDVGDQPVKERTAKEGVLLIATSNVSTERLSELEGKRVKVLGEYHSGTPFEPTPEEEFAQRPDVGLGTENLRGAGFVVTEIEKLSQ
ncbi:MAG: hypothetical protein AAF802_20625 [Planctomycetota bacterium]